VAMGGSRTCGSTMIVGWDDMSFLKLDMESHAKFVEYLRALESCEGENKREETTRVDFNLCGYFSDLLYFHGYIEPNVRRLNCKWLVIDERLYWIA